VIAGRYRRGSVPTCLYRPLYYPAVTHPWTACAQAPYPPDETPPPTSQATEYPTKSTQSRPDTGPETMATLRNAANSLLRLAGTVNMAAALRRNHTYLDKIITLLTSHGPALTCP
jgi:hypothetical protein